MAYKDPKRQKAAQAAWEKANRAKINAAKRDRYAADPESERARLRAYRLANPEVGKLYRTVNGDKEKARKQVWLESHLEHEIERRRAYSRSHRQQERTRQNAWIAANRPKVNAQKSARREAKRLGVSITEVAPIEELKECQRELRRTAKELGISLALPVPRLR